MKLFGCYTLKDKTPVLTRNHMRWSWWMWGPGSEQRRRVAYTEVGETQISTVFMGINSGIDPERPELFETMIFGGLCGGIQWRYATWDEAETGHAVAIELVRRTQNMPQEDGGGTDAETTRDISEE